jgi:hypothetical protein
MKHRIYLDLEHFTTFFQYLINDLPNVFVKNKHIMLVVVRRFSQFELYKTVHIISTKNALPDSKIGETYLSITRYF